MICYGKLFKGFVSGVYDMLLCYDFLGNLCELLNLIDWGIIYVELGGLIEVNYVFLVIENVLWMVCWIGDDGGIY